MKGWELRLSQLKTAKYNWCQLDRAGICLSDKTTSNLEVLAYHELYSLCKIPVLLSFTSWNG